MAFKDTVKEWFKTGFKPTQAQFYSKFDFVRWKDEKIQITDIEDIEGFLDGKADADALSGHLSNEAAHANLFANKEDKTQKGVANGYAPLDEFAKITSQYLNLINDLVTGGVANVLSAEMGKVLQTQITAINTLLTSDDVNLDTVQELVDAIKQVETSLETILVNDLTTGGVTKALTAEMGKLLEDTKANKDGANIDQLRFRYNLGLRGNAFTSERIFRQIINEGLDLSTNPLGAGNLNSASGASSLAANNGPFLGFGISEKCIQFSANPQKNSNLYYRSNDHMGDGIWRKLWHDGNFNPSDYVKEYVYNTFFVDTIDGDDPTAEFENRSKPYYSSAYVKTLPSYNENKIITIIK